MRGGRPINRWGAVLVAALALGACSDDPAPVGPGPSSSTSASSSATTARPQPPPQEATPDSAIAFTRYFWDLYNYAYTTYDTEPLKAISEDDCKYCSSTVADVNRLSEAGTVIRGHGVEVIDAISPPLEIETGTAVTLVGKQTAGQSISSTGKVTDLDESGNIRFTFALAWVDARWMVEGVDFEPVSEKP